MNGLRELEPAVAFLGYLASHDRVLSDPTLSLADNKMQHGYVTALCDEFSDVAVFSSVPATSEQGSAVVNADHSGATVRHLGASPTRWRRVLSRPIVLARELEGWVTRQEGRQTVLVYYNTFLLYGLVAAWLRRRHGTRIVPIAITLPYASPDAVPSRSGQLQDWVSRRLLRSVDGLIAITPFLAETLAPGRPTLVVRGAVPDDMVSDEAFEADDPSGGDEPAHIVYAGNLSHRYHLDTAVAAMAHLPAEKFVLDVYGRGALEPMLRHASDTSPSVRFHGAVAEAEVAPLLREADVLLALLSPDDDLARHSFPSKLFESLASGTPVITTDLPTLGDEMRRHVTVVADLDPVTVARTIISLCERTPEQRRRAASGARDFLRTSGTWSAVGRQLGDFLNSLEPSTHV